MQKFRRPLAKFMAFALVLSLFAGFGPVTLNALAADFLASTVPTQAYLSGISLDRDITVSGNMYMGWWPQFINIGETYVGHATKYEGKYYLPGCAAYNGAWGKEETVVYEDGSKWTYQDPYVGYFSSTDLKTWTLLTAPVAQDVWSKGENVSVLVPLNYKIVMSTGKTVARGGGASALVSVSGLSSYVPSLPEVETVPVSHTVVKGDSLAKIAKQYNVSVDYIRNANYAYFADLEARNKEQGTKVELERDVVLNFSSNKLKGVTYTVQKGDQLWGIAWNYYGTMSSAKVSEIVSANKEYFASTKGVLEAGATIVLPANGIRNPIDTNAIDSAVGIYRVKQNDTVADIAIKFYGSTAFIDKVYQANKERIAKIGSSYMIYEQQWLVITQ